MKYKRLTLNTSTLPITNGVRYFILLCIQGRTTWWNPVQTKEFNEEDEEEDEEEEERNEPDEPEPESGPPLLTPLAEDESMNIFVSVEFVNELKSL